MEQRAKRLLFVLTVLCSLTLTGCGRGTPRPDLPPAPEITGTAECPSPDDPALPFIDGELDFDSPENVRALMERDDVYRTFIKALKASNRCYQAQVAR